MKPPKKAPIGKLGVLQLNQTSWGTLSLNPPGWSSYKRGRVMSTNYSRPSTSNRVYKLVGKKARWFEGTLHGNNGTIRLA